LARGSRRLDLGAGGFASRALDNLLCSLRQQDHCFEPVPSVFVKTERGPETDANIEALERIEGDVPELKKRLA